MKGMMINMVTDIRIYVAIGLFIIACISLMIFNLIIIRFSRRKHTPSARKIDKWMTILYTETLITGHSKPGSMKHDMFLFRKLSKTRHLVTYSHALQILKVRFPKAYSDYVQNRYTTFRKLAFVYARKALVERTCYADLISNFPELTGNSQGGLTDALVSYIDNSSIHCRTKVLSALCSMGNAQGVVNALQIMNEKSLFIHSHLLTNELSAFNGDKEAFADRLWREGQHWNDNFIVSVVQYITKFSNNFKEAFFPLLNNANKNTAVRVAIIRYYEKHTYEPVRPLLIDFLYSHKNIELSVEAASALSRYPSTDTVDALKNALSSPEWHVRYNASASLLKTGNGDDILTVLNSDNTYRKEIIAYMLELEYALYHSNSQDDLFGEVESV